MTRPDHAPLVALPHGPVGRVALGVLSLFLLPVASVLLYLAMTIPRPKDPQDAALLLVLGECGGLLLVVTLSGLAWAVARPAWVQRTLESFAAKLTVALMAFPVLVVGVREVLRVAG